MDEEKIPAAEVIEAAPVPEVAEEVRAIEELISPDEVATVTVAAPDTASRPQPAGIEPDVTIDVVSEPVPELPPMPVIIAEEPIAPPPPPERDYMAEAEVLMRAHPELGHKSVPDEVFRACIENGTPMLQAYDAYLISSLQGDLEKLRAENAALKHNAETQMHAPVVSGGPVPIGSSGADSDPFLRGFNRV